MPEFKKSDLVYPHLFQWNRIEPDSPDKHLDGYLVSLEEGYEVVYFINKFINSHTSNGQPMSIASGQHVEKLLLKLRGDKTLSHMRARAKVVQWVIANWNTV